MAKLVQWRLTNCQSWKTPRTISLVAGLNVIRGDNSAGKSVLFKGLKFSLTPEKFDKDERKEFITWNEEYAEMVYLFDDGQVEIVRIFEKRTLYFYAKDIKTQQYDKRIDSPHDEFIVAMSTLIEPLTGYMVNVLDSDRELFLINPDSDVNNNVVNALTEHKELTRLLDMYAMKIPEADENLKQVYRVEADLDKQLHDLKFTNIMELESKVADADTLNQAFPVLVKGLGIVSNIEVAEHDTKEYDNWLGQIDLILGLDNSGILNPSITEDIITISEIDIELANLVSDLISTDIFKVKDFGQLVTEEDLVIANLANELLNFYTETVFDEEVFNDYAIALNMLDLTENLMLGYNATQNIKTQNDSYNRILSTIKIKEQFLENTSIILEIADTFSDIMEKQTIVEDAEGKLKILEDKMEEIQQDESVLQCPVHGEIIHKNNVCIPILRKDA